VQGAWVVGSKSTDPHFLQRCGEPGLTGYSLTDPPQLGFGQRSLTAMVLIPGRSAGQDNESSELFQNEDIACRGNHKATAAIFYRDALTQFPGERVANSARRRVTAAALRLPSDFRMMCSAQPFDKAEVSGRAGSLASSDQSSFRWQGL
jgi:hypothetical protein